MTKKLQRTGSKKNHPTEKPDSSLPLLPLFELTKEIKYLSELQADTILLSDIQKDKKRNRLY